MKFSVIVPVYNVSRYLKECVDSILAQDYDDYEIILVDDGSTDNSGTLCDEYAHKYRNIKSLHKKNGGLSDARNYGIERALGDYIILIDSDDWIEHGCFSAFAKVILQNKPEVVLTRIIESYDDKDVYRDQNLSEHLENPVTRQQALEWLLKYSENTWPAPLKIVSKKFINENGHQFLKGRLHEDVDWTSKICYTAKKYAVCDYNWYHHRMQRKGSITGSIKGKNITDVIEMAAIHYELYENNKNYIHKCVIERIMQSVYIKINSISKCNESDDEVIAKCIEKNFKIFCIAPTLKSKVFVILMKVLKVKTTLKILRMISR